MDPLVLANQVACAKCLAQSLKVPPPVAFRVVFNRPLHHSVFPEARAGAPIPPLLLDASPYSTAPTQVFDYPSCSHLSSHDVPYTSCSCPPSATEGKRGSQWTATQEVLRLEKRGDKWRRKKTRAERGPGGFCHMPILL